MRELLSAALILFAAPALAWESGVEEGLCTLTHTNDGVAVRLVHDPSVPLYTITITLADGGWEVAPEFGIRFDGARPNTIRTDRHVLSPDGFSLSVSDRGFGNVLDGLQFNEMATGFSGATVANMSLDGAAPAVEAFRSCGDVPTA
jgi:hypothetical protein